MRFMQGRYGTDQLSRVMIGLGLIVFIISRFLSSSIIYTIAIVIIILSYFRMFSRNISKRYKENQWFLQYYNKVVYFFKRKKDMTKQSRNYHIYKCPSCKQRIRVPRGKGKIRIKCPKCSSEFIKRS